MDNLLMMLTGLAIMCLGIYLSQNAIKHLWYISTVRIFVFHNQDLNRLGEAVQLMINKPNSVIINYWALDLTVYIYFRTIRPYIHLFDLLGLPNEYEPNKGYVLGNDLEKVLEILQQHNYHFQRMNTFG